MIVLSARYWALILGTALLAAVPAWLHAGSAMFSDDCANPAELLQTSRIPGTGEGRAGEHIDEQGIFQWTNGEVETKIHVNRPSRYRIVRSFGLAEFYFNPKRFFLGNPFPSDIVTERWAHAGDEKLPYFTRSDHSEGQAVVSAYMVIFDGRPIHGLFAESAASWFSQLFGGTRPVTLLLIDQGGNLEDHDAVVESSEAWLRDAWEYYASVCRPRERGGSGRSR